MENIAEQLEPEKPEVAEQPAEAPVAEAPEPEKKEEVQPEKLVRLEALHEERSKRKALQRETEQLKQNQAVLADRLNQLLSVNQPQHSFVDPNADPDPLKAMGYNQALTIQQVQQLQQRLAQEDQARAQNQQVQQLVGWAQAQAAEFASEAKDFGDAYKFVVGRREAELKSMGLNPQQVRDAVARDELWVYQHAYQSGRNPAEIIYEMAKNTGYSNAPKVDPKQKMEALQKGVDASKSISGGVASGKPTPEQIAAMSEDEFAAFKAELSKSGKRVSDVI